MKAKKIKNVDFKGMRQGEVVKILKKKDILILSSNVHGTTSDAYGITLNGSINKNTVFMNLYDLKRLRLSAIGDLAKKSGLFINGLGKEKGFFIKYIVIE